MSKLIQPTYTTKLPSSGKTVKFRPFTVKEEKSLLLALQDASPDVVTSAIKNTITACTNDQVNPEVIPYYDTEFLFLQIRGKSVGEIIDMVGQCKCDPKIKTEFQIDVTSAYIDPKPTGTKRIKIPDTGYTLEVRHPSLDDFMAKFSESDDTATEIVAGCIVTIFTDDEVMDWSMDEKKEFVESMTTKQQKDIATFLKEMPLCKLPYKYKCRGCGTLHESHMTGHLNFFV